MTQHNPTPAGFPAATPTEPWLDHLRQDAPPPTGGLTRADFTRGVLAAWDKAQEEAQDGPRTPEPWLEQLAASAHAPKPEAFVRRTMEAFAAVQTHRRIRRRTLARLTWGITAVAAAAILAVGLRPWEIMQGETMPTTPTPVRVAHETPSAGPTGTVPETNPNTRSLIAPLQTAAQGWLDRQSRQMQQHVNATFNGAQTKTHALLKDYAVPVHVSRLLLAPVVPAILPAAPAAAPERETPPSPGLAPASLPGSWLM